MSAVIHRDPHYVNLVIAFQSALIWNHRGSPGGSAVGDGFMDDIETAFFKLRKSLPRENAWVCAEELRAQAFREAIKNRDESI